MKKTLFSIILLISIGNAKISLAQTFSLAADTVRFTGYTLQNVINKITNHKSGVNQIQWKVIAHNLPNDWQETIGICDNSNCYGNTVLGSSTSTPPAPPYTPPGTTYTTDTFSNICDFHLQADFSSFSTGGPYYITVQYDDGATTKIGTFLLAKWSTEIESLKAKPYTIYPNPAKDLLHIDFDPLSSAKFIKLYDICGGLITSKEVIGNNVFIDMTGLSRNEYFLEIIDARGNHTFDKIAH